MIDTKTITAAIYTLAVAYNKTIDKNLIKIYCEMLNDLPLKGFNRACKDCIATGKFFPTIAEIRERANQYNDKLQGIPTSEEAWEEVQDQIRKVGSYGKPTFSHKLVRRALDTVGGWEHVCVEASIDIIRSQYIKIYDGMLKTRKENEMLLPEVKADIQEERIRQLNPNVESIVKKLVNTKIA